MFGFGKKKSNPNTPKQTTRKGAQIKRRFATPGVPFYYTPGPVFTEPAMAAIYQTTLQKPAQRILGGGYPVALQLRSIQPPQLFAQPGTVINGIGGQQAGQFAVSSLYLANGDLPTLDDDQFGLQDVEPTDLQM